MTNLFLAANCNSESRSESHSDARSKAGAPTDSGCSDLDSAAHDRSHFIGHLACLVNEPGCPADARDAAMTLIGWLARRMPGETSHALGVRGAIASLAARSKSR